MLAVLRFVHTLQALPSQATIVSPAALLRHISSTRAAQDGPGGQEEPWNQDLLQALLAAIYKVPKTPFKVACMLLCIHSPSAIRAVKQDNCNMSVAKQAV